MGKTAETGDDVQVDLSPMGHVRQAHEAEKGDSPALVADPTAARAAFGWRPARSDLDTIVADAWAWHAARHAPR